MTSASTSMSTRALAVGLAALVALTGCSGPTERGSTSMDPRAAAQEAVEATAASREALGGTWRGSWDLDVSPCEGGGVQFAGYFEQQPSGDQDESEQVMRATWAPWSSGTEIVRTDRPDGSTELLLRRADGFLTLMTVTAAKTSFIATSACFDEADEADPVELLPRSEPGVTVF